MVTRYNNYHKHTHYSNPKTQDSICKPEEYMIRAKELGHTTYFTGEHGFQGNIFEAHNLCEKYGLKCIYSVEAYYVDDMLDKSNRRSYHIMLVAMTQRARKEINKIMSKANTEGFYYKPRIDLNCLLSLTPTETIITTACVASRMNTDDWEEAFFKPVFNHFGKNLYLEVQNHKQEIQTLYNRKILDISRRYNVPIIHANDSHYIYPEDAKYRDLYIKAKGIFYDEEDGFLLDYPNEEAIYKRYKEQGVLTEEEVTEALNNTLIFDKAEPIHLDKEFKIPQIDYNVLLNEVGFIKKTSLNDDLILKTIIAYEWHKEKENIQREYWDKYEDAIKYEIDIIEKCDMARYFIIDYLIVKRAVNEYGAVLTRSGRGSAVSFYVNKLLGLTEVDRLKAPVTLYPTRFMSAERILSSHSLPDIDLNFSNVEPVIQASKDILGEDNIYYMVAYKPLQDSSAFRLWCKAQGLHIDDYNEIAKNLEEYIDDEKWGRLIEESKKFRGVIESIAPSPCSFLLLDKPISEEVGLIRVGKEDSNESVTCCVLDGYYCDVYKYLKNDYLTVSVYEIISRVYKLIGRPIDTISELINKCDDKVWDIYAKGLTTTINQADSDYAKQTLKRYKPTSLAEMSAWVAAIRPGFASLLDNFLDRKPYSNNVDELDDILKDSFHYLIYQESIMKFLVWLGLEEKNTYDIIKKISKKKFTEQELEELKSVLKEGWIKNVGKIEGFAETWQVVEDAAHYSFNASHSLSVAIDSLYGAYLKSYYPLEYFSVALSMYSNDNERTANLVKELLEFGIELKPIRYGKSSAGYRMDKQTNCIYKGIQSVKYCNEEIGEELLKLSEMKYDDFIALLKDINKKTSVNSRQLEILIGLNFFKDFGENSKLLEITKLFGGIKDEKTKKNILPALSKCSQIKKEKIEEYNKFGLSEYLIKKYSNKETVKQYSEIDNDGLLRELAEKIPNKPLNIVEQMKLEKEYLTYIDYTNEKIPTNYYVVIEYKVYKDKNRPYFTIRNVNTGEEIKTKIKKSAVFKSSPFDLWSVLRIDGFNKEYKRKKSGDEWIVTDELELVVEDYEVVK